MTITEHDGQQAMNETYNGSMLKAIWSDWKDVYECTLEDRDVVLLAEKLHAEQIKPPVMLEVFEEASGRALGIGIGGESSVITFQDSLEPPYHISLGDPDRDGSAWFCCGQEESEYPARNLVSWNAAIDALREFVFTRRQPTRLMWEKL